MKPALAICIVGPTASGKSALALALAERIGGEIISVDSMQVYRGLNIGTAKPSREEQDRVRHHLIDVADIADTFDAARFIQLASVAEAEIRKRGRVPVFCGGTGLYFKAWFEGLGESPSPDPSLRAELEQTSMENLLAELQQRDPTTFARIDQKNPRRIIRAVEAIRLTGRPFSELRSSWGTEQGAARLSASFCGLQRSPEDLRLRIDHRVDEMFARGLVEETRSLLAHGFEKNQTAMQAIGYRQVVEHLRGERDLAATIALVKTKTRQFAKRQMTWFRRQADVHWLKPDEALERVISAIQ